MPDSANRSLRVFLCHASGDKSEVRKLYSRLTRDGIDAWLDKEKLIPGQNWQIEIPKAVRNSDIVLVCLSSQSVNKEGFVQKEIKIALDAADEKPEGTIFIIPARLEECSVPERISQFHWVDLFSDNGYEWLLKALHLRASAIGASFEPAPKDFGFHENTKQEEKTSQQKNETGKKQDTKNSNASKLLSKQIAELENLKKLLEKPISAGAVIGFSLFYFGIFSLLSVGIASLFFDTTDSNLLIICMFVAALPTFWVVKKVYDDRKHKTKESLAKTIKEIEELKYILKGTEKINR